MLPNPKRKKNKSLSDTEKFKANPGHCVRCELNWVMPGTKMCPDCCGDWDCDGCNAYSRHRGIDPLCSVCGQMKPVKEERIQLA
jgi:hypothetical protein